MHKISIVLRLVVRKGLAHHIRERERECRVFGSDEGWFALTYREQILIIEIESFIHRGGVRFLWFPLNKKPSKTRDFLCGLTWWVFPSFPHDYFSLFIETSSPRARGGKSSWFFFGFPAATAACSTTRAAATFSRFLFLEPHFSSLVPRKIAPYRARYFFVAENILPH